MPEQLNTEAFCPECREWLERGGLDEIKRVCKNFQVEELVSTVAEKCCKEICDKGKTTEDVKFQLIRIVKNAKFDCVIRPNRGEPSLEGLTESQQPASSTNSNAGLTPYLMQELEFAVARGELIPHEVEIWIALHVKEWEIADILREIRLRYRNEAAARQRIALAQNNVELHLYPYICHWFDQPSPDLYPAQWAPKLPKITSTVLASTRRLAPDQLSNLTEYLVFELDCEEKLPRISEMSSDDQIRHLNLKLEDMCLRFKWCKTLLRHGDMVKTRNEQEKGMKEERKGNSAEAHKIIDDQIRVRRDYLEAMLNAL